MNDKIRDAVTSIIDKVLEAARDDGNLRTNLRVVAEELLSLTAEAEQQLESLIENRTLLEVAPVGSLSVAGVADEIVLESSTQACTSPSPDNIEDDDALASVGPSGNGLGQDIDVPALIDRLWLKAEAARWAAERQRLLANHADLRLEIAPHDRGFYTKGKSDGCFLWMLHPRCRRPGNIDDFDMIAACYETLAEAVALAQFFLQRESAQPIEIEGSLTLLAEAQWALRFAVAGCGGYADDDQQLLYRVLREIADERGVYIATGLKLNDPVDPSEWAAIAGSVHALYQSFLERETAQRKRAKLLNKLKYKASELSAATEPEPDAWTGLIPVVEELVASGLQPSRIEIREALLPIVDRLPSQVEASKAFGLVLREIEAFRSKTILSRAVAPPESPTEEVQKVAKLLAGKSLVMIGATEDQDAAKAIEQAFRLSNVEWVASSEHESYRNFESHISRSDVAAVLLLIRWSSHSFGKVKSLCDRHGKPLIRLPGGYNPNQIAAAILSQASNRLSQKQGEK